MDAAVESSTAKSKRSGAARRRLKKDRQQAIDESFAKLSLDPDTPPRLPPELLYRILRLAAPIITDLEELRGPAGRERNDFLCRASRVVGLREEAQKLLWECVVIKSDKGGSSFLLSKSRKMKTEVLAVEGKEDQFKRDEDDYLPDPPVSGTLSGKIMEEVVEATQGLRSLSLAGVGGGRPWSPLRCWIFAEPCLAGLKKLAIHRSVVFDDLDELDKLWKCLPFTLADLHLDHYWSSECLPEVLVIGLFNSGVTNVKLTLESVLAYDGDGEYPNDPPQLENVWDDSDSASEYGPLKPNFIRSLDLRVKDSWPLSYSEALSMIFGQCDHLETLRTNRPDDRLFRRLPRPITTLSIVTPDDEDCEEVMTMLRRGASALGKLEVLEFALRPDEEERKMEEEAYGQSREALRRECIQRGIQCTETIIQDVLRFDVLDDTHFGGYDSDDLGDSDY